ncbi:DsbA family protein [Klebsiella aerogenes]|uniref:DsbA family protein n=1 Tax=Klebsiella aerogenes TaxID=548 RepID=UPI0034D2C897
MLLKTSLNAPLSRTTLTLALALSGLTTLLPAHAAGSVAASGGVVKTAGAPASPSAFTPEQQAQIGQVAEAYLTAHPEKVGEVMATYLAEHPEFLVAASESLRQRQQASQQQAMVQLAVVGQPALLDKTSPSVGPADAKAAVVMFFDYQCSYCSKMAPVVEALVKANPDVRFVFKEFPIFASRWPVSAFAARTGQQVWLSKGGEAYLVYHNALYATGHVEGQMTEQDVMTAAKPYLDAKTLAGLKQDSGKGAVHDALQTNLGVAQQMHFTGTPAFVVMPQAAKPDAQRVTVLPGATSQDGLQMAIQKARG